MATKIGDSGNNSLVGTAGGDTLDGGIGADTLAGGLGNDTYFIRNYEGGQTSILLQSSPGDSIGGGQTLSFLPTLGQLSVDLGDQNFDSLIDTVGFTYYDNVGFTRFWNLVFSTAQLGTNLAPGTYTNAERAVFASAGHPGLDVMGDGHGSNEVFGKFTVTDAAFDYSGSSPVLLHASISFEQHSESPNAAPLYGTINYNYGPAGPATVDSVVENSGEGIDTIQAWINATLPANVENLVLNGTDNLIGIGNALNNNITGNFGNNSLDGGAGTDTLIGGGGLDTLLGSAGDDSLSGGYRLYGGSGDDTLAGGAGRSDFVFTSLNDLSANGDHVTDFEEIDTIDLRSIGGLHFIGTAAFSGSAGEVRYTFSGSTTSILIDANGDGISDKRIVLDNGNFLLSEMADSGGSSPGSNLLTGLPFVAVETHGQTYLIKGVSNQGPDHFYVQDNGGPPLAIKYQGADVTGALFGGGWAPIAAEKTINGYQIAWQFAGGNHYKVWNTDGNGNYLADAIGDVPGSDPALQSTETLFQQDLNGDGRIGPPPLTAIESIGTTKLATGAGLFYLQDNNGAGPTLKYQGANFVAGQLGAWTPIGAEKTATGYEVAWKFGNANQYTVWNTDANGNYTSNVIGAVPASNLSFQSVETLFQQDLNGDGHVGAAQVAIESNGATTLATAAGLFYLEDGTGAGPILKFQGANFLAGQLGAWTPIGAEKTGSGYEVAWKFGSANQYTVWNTDANGNYVSNLVGAVPASDSGLQSAETLFQQDLNGDGRIGPPPVTAIENYGATTLATAAGLFYLQDSTGAGPILKYQGANFVAGQFGIGGWAPIAAEKTGTGYEIAWRFGNTDQYTLWVTDANGNYLASLVGAVPGSDSSLQAAENLFHQDLNGNGQIGGAVATNVNVTLSDPGNRFPGQASQIVNDAKAAFAMWQPYLAPSVGAIDVNITITPDTAFADGTFTASQFAGVVNGVDVYTLGGGSELVTGNDLNGSTPDIEIRLNPNGLAQSIWIDPLNGSSGPFIKLDLVDVLAHELAHGIAFNGVRDQSTGNLSATYESTFDQYVIFTNNAPYFTGPHAEAVYGGPVPLAVNNLFHVSGGSDLMNPVLFVSNVFWKRYPVSALDVAILSDCGVATNLSDKLAGGPGNDTMNGGIGDDTLSGAAGDDRLTGGPGQDVFLFTSLNDLTANADHVADFDGADAIDLSSVGGVHFIGAAPFSGSAGEMRYASVGQTTSILIDADGDGAYDRRIVLDNHAFALAETSPGSNVLIAVSPVSIEAHGLTVLASVASQFFLNDSGGAGPGLSFQGASVIAGQFGAWTPIGAEKTGNGYEIAWKFGSADQYTLWNTDANGNYVGSPIGAVPGSNSTLQSAETLFQQDLNGDGRIGLPPATPIESNGATRLATSANLFYLQDGTGAGPTLKYQGANFVAGQFGAWTPIGAEATGNGYEIAWKFGSADQYTLWNMDANGNYIANLIGAVAGSDATLQSAEILFQQDLNGNGQIGVNGNGQNVVPATTPIESNGGTTLATAANLFYLKDNANAGPVLKYQGANFVAGQFGAWTPIGAEATGNGYEIAWKFGSADQYTLWNTDTNGNYLSNVVAAVTGSDPTLQAAETLFQQDLNADGHFGLF